MGGKLPRIGIISLESFDTKMRSLVEGKNKYIFDEFPECPVDLKSERLLVFFHTGIVCKHCGISGKYFAIEKQNGKQHLNLYANENDIEILMTKHCLVPKGDLDKNAFVENSECLCEPCNQKNHAIEQKQAHKLLNNKEK